MFCFNLANTVLSQTTLINVVLESVCMFTVQSGWFCCWCVQSGWFSLVGFAAGAFSLVGFAADDCPSNCTNLATRSSCAVLYQILPVLTDQPVWCCFASGVYVPVNCLCTFDWKQSK